MDRFMLCLIYSNNFNNNNKLNNLNYIIAKYKFSRKNKIQNLYYYYHIYNLFPYELY